MGTTSRGPGQAGCADHVDYLDVERRLREALPWERVDLLVARARDRGVPALMMWHWIERYGADLLVLAIGSLDPPVEEPAARQHLRLV